MSLHLTLSIGSGHLLSSGLFDHHQYLVLSMYVTPFNTKATVEVSCHYFECLPFSIFIRHLYSCLTVNTRFPKRCHFFINLLENIFNTTRMVTTMNMFK